MKLPDIFGKKNGKPGFFQEEDGSRSSSRLLALGGGTIMVVSWIASMCVAAAGYTSWERVGKFLEGLTDLFKWLVVPYLGNQAKAAVQSYRASGDTQRAARATTGAGKAVEAAADATQATAEAVQAGSDADQARYGTTGPTPKAPE